MNKNTLKSHMAGLGITQGELAEALGLSKSAISRRLSGEVAFSVDEIKRIKKILKLTEKETYSIFFD